MGESIVAFFLLVCVVFPIFWVVAEIKGDRRARLGFGFLSLLSAYILIVVMAVAMMSQTFTYSERYGRASDELVGAIQEGVAEGENEKVLEAIRQFRTDFAPPYYYDSPPEEYERVVWKTVNRIRIDSSTSEVQSSSQQ
jgi:hypothetical protein